MQVTGRAAFRMLVVLAGVVSAGLNQGCQRQSDEGQRAYWDLNKTSAKNICPGGTPDLNGRVSGQPRAESLRESVDDQVSALATRVGRMQAQLVRLDALGRQLTEVAKLKRGEFDFDEPPAIGGPESAGEGPVVPALDSMLDSMDAQIDDRRRQLTALQNLIMTRELARQIVPGGRPVETGYISSLYGQRTDPFDGNQATHRGIDFAGVAGTEVLAVADGIVSHTGLDGGYGRMIEVTHGDGYVTRYAHNAKILVKPGQTVKRGDAIALMGSTGRSTGPHVHFEVLRNGKPMNPLAFVKR